MIHESRLAKVLASERDYWARRQPQCEFIQGIIFGLKVALQCLGKAEKFKVPSWMSKEKLRPTKEIAND